MSDFLFTTTTTMNQTPLPASSSSSSYHDDNDGSFGGDVENQQQQQHIFIMSSVVDSQQSLNFHLLQQIFAFIGVVATVISVIAVLYYLYCFKISSKMIDDDDKNTKPVQEKVLESPSSTISTSTNNNTNDSNIESPPSFHIRSFETLFTTQQQSVQYFFDNVNMKQFEHVNQILLRCSNNNHLVHFCGVGKSGVVAQKLAVTLTSTGTRSLYLNPTDALHGDLGMVQEGDVVVLISKSGESDELVKLMPFLNNRLSSVSSSSSSSSSCIAMVSNKHSRLAKLCGESNILEMPMLQELCPFNMVPTTSVALQMIMGDALAVSLMEHKQVHLDQFAKNHPAGRIGKRLCLKVRDVMTMTMTVVGQQQQESNSSTTNKMKNVDFVVDADMLAYDAMKMMKEKSVTSLPVVVAAGREENENIVGVLRLQDLVQAGL